MLLSPLFMRSFGCFYLLFRMTQNIADTMAYLQGEGRLLRGEHNHLCEAFLVMTSSAGYLAAKSFCIYAST